MPASLRFPASGPLPSCTGSMNGLDRVASMRGTFCAVGEVHVYVGHPQVYRLRVHIMTDE